MDSIDYLFLAKYLHPLAIDQQNPALMEGENTKKGEGEDGDSLSRCI
jgi:hypothetical protein